MSSTNSNVACEKAELQFQMQKEIYETFKHQKSSSLEGVDTMLNFAAITVSFISMGTPW